MQSCPTVTVAVCTRNRAALLHGLMDILARQEGVPGGYEVLVVDNGSTDDTGEVVAQRQVTMPNLRYVVEPKAGHSRARNTAIREATGDIIIFTDDDVRPGPGWVGHVVQTFIDRPEIAAFGGPVELLHDRPFPRWLDTRLQAYIARCDHGAEPHRLDFPTYPVGANMAFQRDVLADEVHGFEERLGHTGKLPQGCDEATVFLALADLNRVVWYDPTHPVGHIVGHDRTGVPGMALRLFGEGLGRVELEKLVGPRLGTYSIRVSLAHVLRRGKPAAVRGALAQRSTAPLITELVWTCFHVGVIVGLVKQRRAGRRRRS